MEKKEVKRLLEGHGLDAIILFSKSPPFEHFLPNCLDSGIMIITRKEKILFVSRLHLPRFPSFKAIQYSNFLKDLRGLAAKKKLKRIGYDGNSIYLRQKKFLSKHFKTKDVGKYLSFLRQEKTKEEMKRIRQACKISDEIFSLIIKKFKSFRKESDITKFIKIEAMKRDAEMAFEPIAASGRNATVAHHNKDSILQKGFMVLDFGAKYEGYCSDMTRTIYIGSPNKEEISIYEKVLAIQLACIEKAGIGTNAGKLHEYALDKFGDDAKHFIHGLGHGFGIEIHEGPSLSPNSKVILKKGNVVTIEPGYYNKKIGIGIRIEDDLYFGDKKEVLTRSTKKLIIIKAR
jgi:Xaa-Pro aminopeptidase